MDQWMGVVIEESLDDPAIINRFAVDKVLITPPFKWRWTNLPPGQEEIVARWHLYRVSCAADDIALFHKHIRPGWYAHFWKDQRMTVIFSDARFEVASDDRSTWTPVIEHGRRHGILDRELDFKSI